MTFTIGLAQVRHPEGGDVIALVERYARQAQAQGADMLVFPESLMSRYESSVQDFTAASQPVDGPFAQAVDALAATYGLWLVYTLNELNPGAKPFNTALITDSTGARRGIYRKTHLFESPAVSESSRMSAGNALCVPVQTPWCMLGLGICYDLRFPEVARSAALAGCDVLLYPSAWFDGPLKARQWRTLLACRAIENQMYVAGVSRCDEGYIGQSCMVDPYGTVVAAAGATEELLCCRVDMDRVREARSAMPVLQNRRSELYLPKN